MLVHGPDNSELKLLQQFGFQPDTAGAFLEMPAADQEGVFDPFTEGGDLGGVQIGMVLGQLFGDDEQQSRATGSKYAWTARWKSRLS